MHWSAEEFVLVITGVLFAGIVASSRLPRVELTPTSLRAFAIGAAVFIGAAAALATVENASYPPLLWILPLVPLMVIVVLVRDALVGGNSEATDQTVTMGAQGGTADSGFVVTQMLVGTGETLAADPGATAEQLAEIAYAQPTLRPVVAANPATPSNLLEWLASLGDPAVQRAIGARAAH
ncbi:hypothetical protein [Demequina zhanjiangensis]|uniref:Leucine rich repeat variant domain-containing protein n=1 Tax=Demequina zhanjiangensis TaxID=3051659 RepID=A0ABT8FZF0_9MICO|nr:hypothetical protein [Demequina sp. SYSU T00b26]MDN4472270.1 hypothetical protein [Demequina sp. SYSU T00b26]